MRSESALRATLVLGGLLLAACDAFDADSTPWKNIERPGFGRERKGNVLPAAALPVRLRARYIQHREKDRLVQRHISCFAEPCNPPEPLHVHLEDPHGRTRIELGSSAGPAPTLETDRVYVFSGELLYPEQPYTGASQGSGPVTDWATSSGSITLRNWRIEN